LRPVQPVDQVSKLIKRGQVGNLTYDRSLELPLLFRPLLAYTTDMPRRPRLPCRAGSGPTRFLFDE
jgi:hypothetical protein